MFIRTADSSMVNISLSLNLRPPFARPLVGLLNWVMAPWSSALFGLLVLGVASGCVRRWTAAMTAA